MNKSIIGCDIHLLQHKNVIKFVRLIKMRMEGRGESGNLVGGEGRKEVRKYLKE